ncbi:hypothetical protein F4782DRAFT_128715 [Xylaria castorea]|nr:hypothetical protein F4782DRAFT_128715 [Xylaria castorea]
MVGQRCKCLESVDSICLAADSASCLALSAYQSVGRMLKMSSCPGNQLCSTCPVLAVLLLSRCRHPASPFYVIWKSFPNPSSPLRTAVVLAGTRKTFKESPYRIDTLRESRKQRKLLSMPNLRFPSHSLRTSNIWISLLLRATSMRNPEHTSRDTLPPTLMDDGRTSPSSAYMLTSPPSRIPLPTRKIMAWQTALQHASWMPIMPSNSWHLVVRRHHLPSSKRSQDPGGKTLLCLGILGAHFSHVWPRRRRHNSSRTR